MLHTYNTDSGLVAETKQGELTSALKRLSEELAELSTTKEKLINKLKTLGEYEEYNNTFPESNIQGIVGDVGRYTDRLRYDNQELYHLNEYIDSIL